MTSRILTVLLAGSLIAFLSFGIRSTLGNFNELIAPDSSASVALLGGITFGGFSLALALQNLFWGLTQPFSGGLADRFGPVRVMMLGALLYFAGVASMPYVSTNLTLYLGAGLLAGVGISFTSFNLVIAAFTRLLPGTMRGLAMGLGTAMGSAGQMVLNPFVTPLIGGIGWESALFTIGALCLVMMPMALVLRGSDSSAVKDEGVRQSVGAACREAFANPSYLLLVLGFFVCGFHIAFITVHMPRFVTVELGMAAWVPTLFLAAVGGFNIIGSLAAGWLSGRGYRPKLLALIYMARGVLLIWFVAALALYGPQVWIVLVLGAIMGLLWLATVPPTTGIVANMFGLSHMAMLYGFTFVSHQIGSFAGVIMGGWFFSTYGTYMPIWYFSIGLALLAFALHWPIRDRPTARLQALASSAGSV